VHYAEDVRKSPGQPVPLLWNDIYGNCYEENPDIAPVDGWVLLTGNFGTSLIIPQPDYPYFVLYNRYRGMLSGIRRCRVGSNLTVASSPA
jgi:hypothetical protein